MSKLSIVIVETDETYLSPIELKFVEELGEDAEIEIITELAYYEEYFENPHSMDILVINETLYGENVKKQHVENTFVLEEEEKGTTYASKNIVGLYKYSSIKEIFHTIIGKAGRKIISRKDFAGSSKTVMIMVYSPIGGCGKTTAAFGICGALAKLNKRVLYLNLETIQGFQWYLKDKESIKNGFERYFSSKNENIMEYFSGAVGSEGFDYLRPISQSTLSHGIKEEDYAYLIDQLLAAKIYDYIIYDSSAELTLFKTKLMGKCNKNVIIVMQDAFSVWKVEQFLKNIEYGDDNKFVFACNNYSQEKGNMIFENEYLKKCSIAEYVKRIESQEDITSMEDISRHAMFQTTAYLLL